MNQAVRLIFEDGKMFSGRVFARGNNCSGEVVFNTAMTGYQEILTDPSYKGQMVVMTYPMIGNYGITPEDVESRQIFVEALIVKEYVDTPSNWRSKKTLKAYLEENNVLGVEGFDTRAITRYVRDNGAHRAILTTSDIPTDTLIEKVKQIKPMAGQNLAEAVTISQRIQWKKPESPQFKVAVIDCGVKYNILEQLRAVGCECDVYPASVDVSDILNGQYNGVFFSNGPGDPEPVASAVSLAKKLIGKLPVYGICLGHQILGLALGATTYKLKFGHHGANHPILNKLLNKVEITSQNHGFALDKDSLKKDGLEVTHINLNDQTIAGIRHRGLGLFSVQYHPEAAPGPHDSRYFFNEFVEEMKRFVSQNLGGTGNA